MGFCLPPVSPLLLPPLRGWKLCHSQLTCSAHKAKLPGKEVAPGCDRREPSETETQHFMLFLMYQYLPPPPEYPFSDGQESSAPASVCQPSDFSTPGTETSLPVYPQLHSFPYLSEGLQMLSGLYCPAQEELQETASDKELIQSKRAWCLPVSPSLSRPLPRSPPRAGVSA